MCAGFELLTAAVLQFSIFVDIISEEHITSFFRIEE
jgi:hypothetical protein